MDSRCCRRPSIAPIVGAGGGGGGTRWRAAVVLVLLVLCLPCVARADPSQAADLKTVPIPDGRDKSRFGTILCTNADGDRLVVGADVQNKLMGGAYVLDVADSDLDAASFPSSLRWTPLVPDDLSEERAYQSRGSGPREKGSSYGFACAMTKAGDAVAITAPGHKAARGTVFIYRYGRHDAETTTTEAWQLTDRIELETLRRGDGFGYRVASSADGTTLAVTSKIRNFGQGEAFVMHCGDRFENCKLATTLSCPDVVHERTETGIRISATFGVSVSMNVRGDRMVIGATGFRREQGAAYVFEKGEDGQWVNTTRLVSSDPVDFGYFGFKCGMDDEGELIAVGADGEEDYRGSVYVFQRGSNGTWHPEKALRLSRRMPEDNFGGAVHVTGDGKSILVGAPGVNVNGKKDAGSVYIYDSFGHGDWVLQRTLQREEIEAGAYFGWSIVASADGDRYIVSAPYEDRERGSISIGRHARSTKRNPNSDSLAADDVVSFSHDEL